MTFWGFKLVISDTLSAGSEKVVRNAAQVGDLEFQWVREYGPTWMTKGCFGVTSSHPFAIMLLTSCLRRRFSGLRTPVPYNIFSTRLATGFQRELLLMRSYASSRGRVFWSRIVQSSHCFYMPCGTNIFKKWIIKDKEKLWILLLELLSFRHFCPLSAVPPLE